jgi:hypothetical protein
MLRLAIAVSWVDISTPHDLAKRVSCPDQQYSSFATAEVYERIFPKVHADPVDHPRRYPQRRREKADCKVAGFGIADAEITRLNGAGRLRAMPGIELQVELRRVDPVRELGHGRSPAEALKAVANALQSTGSRRRSPTHVVECRLYRVVIVNF